MSVPGEDEPGAAYFHRGADVLSVPGEDEPGAAYFHRGADLLSVPASEASADEEAIDEEAINEQPADEQAPDEAASTPGTRSSIQAVPPTLPAESADALEPEVGSPDSEPTETSNTSGTAETSAGDFTVDLPWWTALVDTHAEDTDEATDDQNDPNPIAHEPQDGTGGPGETTSPDASTETPTVFDHLEDTVRRLALGVGLIALTLVIAIAVLVRHVWRAFQQHRRDKVDAQKAKLGTRLAQSTRGETGD
jgi:hypothetical protein